jgi:hypothetical protein
MASIKPLVYGYIRMEEPDEAKIAGLRTDLGEFCSTSDYHLDSIFVDLGVSDGVFARTEFTRLLAAARETGAHGVVVPALSHFPSDTFVQDALVRMVELTGAAVFVVNKPDGDDSPPVGREGERGAGNAVTALVRREVPAGLVGPDPADEDDQQPQISPVDRELIERTRNANKALSLFVLAPPGRRNDFRRKSLRHRGHARCPGRSRSGTWATGNQRQRHRTSP